MSTLPTRSYTSTEEYQQIFDGLDTKEQRFVELYVLTGKLKDAAGQTFKTEEERRDARLLLRDPYIQRAVTRLKAFFSRHLGAAAENIIAGLEAAAFHDPFEITADDGSLLPLEDWPLAIRCCVEEYETKSWVDRDGMLKVHRKVKFMSRTKAMELLGRYRQLWSAEPQRQAQYQLVIHMESEPDPASDPALNAKPVHRIHGAGVTIEFPPEDEEDGDDS